MKNNKFEAFKGILDLLEVYYTELNDKEIIIPAPSITALPLDMEELDFVSPQTANEHYKNKNTATIQDETSIHITYNEEDECLDWCIVLCENWENE